MILQYRIHDQVPDNFLKDNYEIEKEHKVTKKIFFLLQMNSQAYNTVNLFSPTCDCHIIIIGI